MKLNYPLIQDIKKSISKKKYKLSESKSQISLTEKLGMHLEKEKETTNSNNSNNITEKTEFPNVENYCTQANANKNSNTPHTTKLLSQNKEIKENELSSIKSKNEINEKNDKNNKCIENTINFIANLKGRMKKDENNNPKNKLREKSKLLINNDNNPILNKILDKKNEVKESENNYIKNADNENKSIEFTCSHCQQKIKEIQLFKENIESLNVSLQKVFNSSSFSFKF